MDRRRPLRLLHTSDLHLGARAHDPHLDLLRTVMTLGADLHVDAFLLAGDIFDHNRVKTETISDALESMDVRAPVLILPGNHDCLVEDGVYERGQFAGSRVTVLGLGGEDIAPLHGLGVTVWGRAHRHHRDLLPLRDPPDFDPNGWRVVMAHGHWVRQPEDHRRAYRIFQDDLDAQTADYIALGHWDVFNEVPALASVASYSGSPLYAGTVNIVELDPRSGVRVSRVAVTPEGGT
jgi:DNA repair exonuclease SbcCD nuclease subunit